MKKSILKKSISLTVIFMLIFSLTAFANESTISAEETGNRLSVSGTHKIKVIPDVAYITIGVSTFHKDAKIAQEENSTKMNNVMKQLKNLGIEDENIKTVSYMISPRYEWNDIERKNTLGDLEKRSERVLVGYDVTNRIKLTIKDIKKTGDIIDLTVKEGINEANSIYFDLSEEKRNEAYLEALKGAVEDAHKKALAMASVFNIKLGVPLSISESGSYIPAPIPYRSIAGASESVAFDAAPTPISEGEMEIVANVNLVYKY